MTDWMKNARVVAVIGCPPLPGSRMYRPMTRDQYLSYVDIELDTLFSGGVRAVMIQNIGDLPVPSTARAETIAWMAMLGGHIRARHDGPMGISILEDDAEATIAIAHAIGADFVRLKVFVGTMTGPDGLRQGNAYVAQKYRALLGADNVKIFADVYDRTRWPLEGERFEEMVHEAIWYGKADGLVITGRSVDETLALLARVRTVTDAPVWAGGGADAMNINQMLEHADGVIMATSLKHNESLLEPMDGQRVSTVMSVVDHVKIQTQ